MNLQIGLPDFFLEEETRNDFLITEERKKIWAISLDLLAQLDRVCKKHHLTYYVFAGAALGAARHKGFIPWDDDIDVIMTRSEYEKLCKIAPKEFESPYFFQTNYTDFGARWGHAKLRNSHTTCIANRDKKYERTINQGIFLDVFPADHVMDDDSLFKKQKKWAEFYRINAKRFAEATKESYRYHPNKGVDLVYRILASLFGPLNRLIANYLWKKFEKVCQRYNNQETENFGLLSFQFSKKWIQSRDDYKGVVNLPFEFTTVPVCSNYEHALTMLYGDWHKLVRGDSQHEGFYFDPDHPYKEFFRKTNKVEK